MDGCPYHTEKHSLPGEILLHIELTHRGLYEKLFLGKLNDEFAGRIKKHWDYLLKNLLMTRKPM